MQTKSLLDFDYQATTPCELEVLDAMQPYWQEFYGNPSNRQNRSGLYVSAAIELARDQLASCLNIKPDRLIFTSGATEANNLALLGFARRNAEKLGFAGHLITLTTEHNSVLEPLRQLRKEGFELTEIRPNSDGLIDIKTFEKAFKKNTILVSIMLANNEIGVIQPLSDITSICKGKGVIFHTDAAQAFGNVLLKDELKDIGLLTISAHKIYGPKGIGALFIREDIQINSLHYGGAQEMGLRPGTLPAPLIIGFGKAAELAFNDMKTRNHKLLFLRNKLWNGLKEKLPEIKINGSLEHRLAHNLNFTIPGINSSQLQRALRSSLTCSSGSACSNGEPSYVLRELGRSIDESKSSVRLSLGRNTSIKQIDAAIKIIFHAVRDNK